MGIADIFLPAAILVVKFLCRLFIGRDVEDVEYFQALLAFPTDIAFLSFSYGAASLASKHSENSEKAVFAFALWILIATIVCMVLSRRSDKAFSKDQNIFCFFIGFANYAVALLSVGITITIGAIL
jgi:hypothetical protein